MTFFLNVALWGHCPIVQAQIVTDGTVGAAGSLSGPNYTIPAALGKKFGANLFHSFLDFQLAKGESATFSGPSSVHNILSRVTGGLPSSIDGQLNSTIGGANFFFLNPSGVVFGPNAQINVGGSFVVSTADVVKLGTSGTFNALDPSATVLTSAPPLAFGFLTPNPQPIIFSGSQLSGAPGRSFSAIGGGIGIYDGSLLQSTGGLNLVSVGSTGEVTLDADNAAKPVDGTGFTAFGGIELKTGSVLRANGAGSIALYGESLLVDNAGVIATNDGSTTKPSAIDVKLAGNMVLENGSLIQSITKDASPGPNLDIQAAQIILRPNTHIEAVTTGAGNGGSINLSATKLQLADGSVVITSTQGKGQGGALSVNVNDLEATGSGGDTGLFALTQGAGNGGKLTIAAKNARFFKAGASTNSVGAGDAGALNLTADTLVIDGGQTTKAGVGSDARFGGAGGAVTIKAGDVQVLHGGVISTSTFGNGNGGSIDLTANNILFEGSTVATGIQTATLARGASGTVVIRAGKLQIVGNASIFASTLGQGKGGSINVNADQILLDGRNQDFDSKPLSGNGLISESRAANSGIGGKINVTTQNLEMKRGGSIRTSTFSSRRGGAVVIHAGKINIDGTEKTTGIAAGTLGSGQSGKIRLYTDSLQMLGKAVVTTSTAGAGVGGQIVIIARDIILNGAKSDAPKGITSVALAGSTGDAGHITIRTSKLRVSGPISIDTSTEAAGNSGNINIDADQILIDGGGTSQTGIDSSSVNETSGNSGEIHINTGDLEIRGDGAIASVTAGNGQGGLIDIKANNILIDAQNQPNARNIVSDTGGVGGNAAGGTITIDAKTIKMQNGATISSNTFGAGNGGSVVITAPNTSVESGSFVSALTRGAGTGGGVTVNASNQLTVDGKGKLTGFSADTDYFGPNVANDKGNGGTINLNAKQIVMTDNAYTSTSSINPTGQISTGNAGQINIQTGDMLLDHSFVGSVARGAGRGGGITLNSTGSVTLDAGQISARAAQSTAGNILLNVSDTLGLSNISTIDTAATQLDGGNININFGRSFRAQRSIVSAFANHDGGSVNIQSTNGQNQQSDILLYRSVVVANAVTGDGGRIVLRSRVFLPSAESIIDASSSLGTDGTVSIESPNASLGGSLITLPSNLLDAESFLAARCVTRETGAISSFTVEPLNGTPAKPGDLLPSPAPH